MRIQQRLKMNRIKRLITKETVIISSPMTGTAADLSTAPDEAFASKMMGDGAVVTPKEGFVAAPEDGTVLFVFDTKHAVNLVSDDGCEILLHIGIDTVKLGGKYFESHVSDGQEIHKGDLLISFKLDSIRSEGYKNIVCYGISFYQKDCLIKMKSNKNN